MSLLLLREIAAHTIISDCSDWAKDIVQKNWYSLLLACMFESHLAPFAVVVLRSPSCPPIVMSLHTILADSIEDELVDDL